MKFKKYPEPEFDYQALEEMVGMHQCLSSFYHPERMYVEGMQLIYELISMARDIVYSIQWVSPGDKELLKMRTELSEMLTKADEIYKREKFEEEKE